MPQYFVDLKDLAGGRTDKVLVEGVFEPGDLDFDGENVRQVEPLGWKIEAEQAGEEIRIVGGLQTVMDLGCSRCLEPTRTEISRAFDLFFRQHDDSVFDEDEESAEIELNEKDTRTAFFTGTQLAIGDIVREQLLLALPMKALCRLDCKGLCPSCGANLNINPCNCPAERVNPRMEQLLEIKRHLEERSS